MSEEANTSEQSLQTPTFQLQTHENEAVPEKPADVNLQTISQDGDEESTDNLVETPGTNTPTTLNEDSNAESSKEPAAKAFPDLSDDAEDTLESNTESGSVEPMDALPDTDMDTMDSDDKEPEVIVPEEISNEMPEDSLDSVSINTAKDTNLESDAAQYPDKPIDLLPHTEESETLKEVVERPSEDSLDGNPKSCNDEVSTIEEDKSAFSTTEEDKSAFSTTEEAKDVKEGTALVTGDSVDKIAKNVDDTSHTEDGKDLAPQTSEVTARVLMNTDEQPTVGRESDSNKSPTQNLTGEDKIEELDADEDFCLAVGDDDVEETVLVNKSAGNTGAVDKEGKTVKEITTESPNKSDNIEKTSENENLLPSPIKTGDVDKENLSELVKKTVQPEVINEKIPDTKTCAVVTMDVDTGVENPEESLETMDTCDSQESTNLIIDETCDINESREENESQSKEETETRNAESTECENTAKDKNLPVEDNKEKCIDQTAKVATDTATQSDNKKEASVDNTSNVEESKHLDESKDDDVITIEQPPMPIIEIDDDDDDDEPPSKKSPIKETKSDEQQAMEIDDESPQETASNNTAPSKEMSSSIETTVAKDDLLTVSSEKTMSELSKEDETKKTDDDMEDTTDEVFYNKECINYECAHKHKQYFRVPQFAFSYFKVNKKKFKVQYICADCYDKALEMYEEYCGLISAKQPLLLENIPSGRQEFVEIIDSSDEEDASDSNKITEPSKSAFSKNDLSLIERELHNTIKSVLERVEIQNQLTWSKTILSERLKRLAMETDYVDSELKSLQRKADKMHEGLYSCPKIKIRQLQPLDLNSGKMVGYESQQTEAQPIPPVGEIERPSIQNGGTYFAVKNNAIASWVPCKVVEQVEGGVTAQKNVKYYRIKFLKSVHYTLKTVPAKYLAYYEPPTVRLPIGTRVIAYFDATSLARGREKMNVQSAFYPGIIAEPLKPNNKFRYLIFYDDGYTQYVYHKDVRLVCHVSENVWEDVHPASRDFIQKYLTQYSINRPMVQTQKGQSMNTESNGYWLHARVVDIDCSLVLMQFEGSKSHTEWIYRGSLRLGPVFKEYQKTLQKNSTVPVSRLPRRTEPFIRYTEDEESSSQQQQSEKANEGNRAVARKSFGRPESMMNSSSSQSSTSQQQQQLANIQTVKHLNNSTIYVEDENKPKGKVVYYTAKRNLPPRKYTPHTCSPACLFEITHNLSAYSPLSKPLLSGWERFIIRQKIKKVVTYRAPCGKIFRNMKELHNYLRITKNTLNVDNFDFSHDTNCLAEYVIESAIIQKRDISCGQEKMAIPLVNYYDNTLPPECKYSAKVIPTEGVHINKDPEFFAGCDCDDDCSDKSKCSCWQLTIAGAKYGNPNTPVEEVGYQYKRLLEHVPTGIYECNPRCKCKQNCLNRVVQHSLQLKLQVFKTSNRGWGLRCINDVPRGTFVCVYAGHLLTEAKANEGGQDAGDEYFAELDYIEVAEQIKEGYESEVEPPEPEDEDTYQPEMDDDDFTPSKSFLTRSKRQNATKSTRSGNQEDDSQERQVINFNPNADMNEDSVRENSIRKLYGKDEACYVMDAKISGNLGRYFNHSCAPNMFVQNVFVDTHDLRFPWVAFFSSCNIRAGTELTWNYNYEVGVVPGKVLYCQCGAANCRLRLL